MCSIAYELLKLNAKQILFFSTSWLFWEVWAERMGVLLGFPSWTANDELHNLWNSHLTHCKDGKNSRTHTIHIHVPSSASPRSTELYTLIKKSLLTFMRPINFTRAIKTIWSFIKISLFLLLFLSLAHCSSLIWIGKIPKGRKNYRANLIKI